METAPSRCTQPNWPLAKRNPFPTFLSKMVITLKPHLPFNAPTKYWALYDADELPPIAHKDAPKNIITGMQLNSSFELLGQYDVPFGGLNDEAYKRK